MAEIKWFTNVDYNFLESMPHKFWMREYLAEANNCVRDIWRNENEEINFWDIRVILIILCIPLFYLATPGLAFYVKKESLKELKAAPNFQTRSKKNQELLTIMQTLKGKM